MAIDKEQVELAAKFNSLVETMARNVDRVEKTFETQVATVEKLVAAMQQVDADKAVESISSMSTSLKGVIEKIKEMSTLSKTLEEVATKADKAGTSASSLKDKLFDAGKAVSAIKKDPLDALNSAFNKAGGSAGGMSNQVANFGKWFSKKFPTNVAVGTGALLGFIQGIRNLVALGKSATSFLASVGNGIISISASILAIPLKILSGLVNMAANANVGANELAQAIENLRKEFGALSGPTPRAIITMSQTLKGFSDTGLAAFRVFGTLAERIESFTKLAVGMGATFTQLTQEFERNGGAILAYQKGLGISDEQMAAFGQKAIATGQTLASVLKDTTKYATEMGKAFGIDSKIISKDMAKALVDVKHFAGASVKEIAQASVYARKLGVELDKIVGTLDAFETFDSAAENAAKLSQAFGVQVDAFKLMEAQDPASQLDQLRKAFNAAGKSAEGMSRQELKLLAQTTGLDEATAKMAFAAQNQGLSLDEIKKKSAEAEKKTLTQAEAMAKLADSIERLVKSGGPQSSSFFDQFFKGFLGGIQMSKEFRQIIWNIKRSLQLVYFEGVRLGKAFVEMFPGMKDVLGGLADFFKPGKFKALASGVTNVFIDFFRGLTSGQFSFGELMTQLQKKFFDFFDAESPSGRRTLEGFKTLFKTIIRVVAEGIKWVSTKVGEAMQLVVDVIRDPSKLMSGAESAGSTGLGFLADALLPLVGAMQHAWKVIAPAAFDMLKLVGEKIVGFLKSKEFMNIIRPAFPFLATVLFGPMVSRAILGGLASSLIKNVLSGGATGVIKKAAMSLGGKVGGGTLGKIAGVAGPIGLVVAAGAAIGNGIEKYTDQITTTMDRSSKTIAAGATGIVDAITFGLLPDGFSTQIANVLAEATDTVFGLIGSVFGSGFSDSMKRHLSGLFEVFGNVWSLLKNMFTGDQGAFNTSAKELGLSVLRFVASSLESVVIQLPILGLKLVTKILSTVTSMTVSVVSAALGLVASGIDKVFGTELSKKVESLSDSLKTGISKLSDQAISGLDSASVAVSAVSKDFQDTMLRSSEDQAKQAAQAVASSSKSVSEAQAEASKDAAKQAESSLQDVAKNISSVKNIQKELDKGFNLGGAVTSIREKIAGVSFDIISPEQVTSLGTSAKNLEEVITMTSNVESSLSQLAAFPKVLTQASNALKRDMRPAVEIVNKMIDSVSDLNTALADGDLNKINIAAKLSNVAKSLGLGAKGSYSVQNKGVNLTVNLQVSLDVSEVEKVVVLRKSSIIRDRLNFLTDNSPGVSQLPENTDGAVQPLANAPRTK